MTSKKYLNQSLVIVLSVFLLGCAGTSICRIPVWYHDTISNQGFIYAKGMATDTDINLAVDKAKIDATNILKSRLKTDILALIQKAIEELDLEPNNKVIEQFSQITEQVFLDHLQGVKIDKRFVCVEEKKEVQKGMNVSNYRAYVLIQYDEAFACKRLIDQINKDELLYDAISTTGWYDEIINKIENYK